MRGHAKDKNIPGLTLIALIFRILGPLDVNIIKIPRHFCLFISLFHFLSLSPMYWIYDISIPIHHASAIPHLILSSKAS